MNKTRDLNSLSWMPQNVPISTRIWERGFYLKDGVVKYRHGFKRKAIYWKTTMGILFYTLISLFVISIFSLPFYGSLSSMMLVTLLAFIVIVYMIAYQRAGYTKFNLEKSNVTGLRCYKEENCLDFLFPDNGSRIAVTTIFYESMDLNDIMRVFLYNRNKLASCSVFYSFDSFLVVVNDVLDHMILLDCFGFFEGDHLNDYIDGVKAIIGRKVWVDESEK